MVNSRHPLHSLREWLRSSHSGWILLLHSWTEHFRSSIVSTAVQHLLNHTITHLKYTRHISLWPQPDNCNLTFNSILTGIFMCHFALILISFIPRLDTSVLFFEWKCGCCLNALMSCWKVEFYIFIYPSIFQYECESSLQAAICSQSRGFFGHLKKMSHIMIWRFQESTRETRNLFPLALVAACPHHISWAAWCLKSPVNNVEFLWSMQKGRNVSFSA